MDPRTRQLGQLRRRVLVATFATTALPGLGLWLAGRRLAGGLVLGAAALLAAALGAHLALGIGPFESPLGSFLFGVCLRAGAILYAFAIVESYLTALHPEDRPGMRRRAAVALNLLVPGAGYFALRAWIRAGTGLLLLTLLLAFAGARYHRYIDIVFVITQLLMAAAAYQQARIASAAAGEELPEPPLDPVGPAQITALVAVLGALIFSAYVVHLRMPDYSFANVTQDQVRISPSTAGIRASIPALDGVSITAVGDGWIAEKAPADLLFSAQHENGATLQLGTELMLPFLKPRRYVEHLRRRMVAGGFSHQKTKALRLNGIPAYQLLFSRPLGSHQRVDQWIVAIPRGHYSFLLLIQCNRVRCREILPVLERSRDSFKIEAQAPAGPAAR